MNRPKAEPRVAFPDAMRKNPCPRGRQNEAVTFVSYSVELLPSMYPRFPPPGPSALALSARRSKRACVSAPSRCLGKMANTSTSVHGSASSRAARVAAAPVSPSARAESGAHARRSSAAPKAARRATPCRDIADMALPPRVAPYGVSATAPHVGITRLLLSFFSDGVFRLSRSPEMRTQNLWVNPLV